MVLETNNARIHWVSLHEHYDTHSDPCYSWYWTFSTRCIREDVTRLDQLLLTWDRPTARGDIWKLQLYENMVHLERTNYFVILVAAPLTLTMVSRRLTMTGTQSPPRAEVITAPPSSTASQWDRPWGRGRHRVRERSMFEVETNPGWEREKPRLRERDKVEETNPRLRMREKVGERNTDLGRETWVGGETSLSSEVKQQLFPFFPRQDDSCPGRISLAWQDYTCIVALIEWLLPWQDDTCLDMMVHALTRWYLSDALIWWPLHWQDGSCPERMTLSLSGRLLSWQHD